MYDVFIVKFINFIFKRIHEDWKNKIRRRGTLSPSSLLQLINSTAQCMSDMPWFYTLRKKLWKLTQCLSISTFDFIHSQRVCVYMWLFSCVIWGFDFKSQYQNNNELRIHTSPFFTFGIQLSIISDHQKLRSMFFHKLPQCPQSVWNATFHKHSCLRVCLLSCKPNACSANNVTGLLGIHACTDNYN